MDKILLRLNKCFFTLSCFILFSLLFNESVFALPAPVITSVSVVSGIPLSGTVVITGTGFNDTASRNIVRFGGVTATVTAASATSLTVTVPMGATYAPINVLNVTTHLSAVQDGFFLPVYDNNCFVPNSASFKPRTDMVLSGTVSTNNHPRHIAMGDMNGDGKPDMVVCTYDALSSGISAVFVYKNIGGQGIVNYAAPVICSSGAGGTNVKLADLDGDGKLDIIVACSGSGVISCIRNTTTAGTLSFAAKRDIYPHEGAPELAIEDFDGDGKLDIAATCYSTSTVKLFRNRMTTVPAGIFPASFFGGIAVYDSFDVSSFSGGNPGSMASADFDNDGKMDLVTSNTYDGSVSVLKNTSVPGAFSFQPHVEYTVPGTPTEVQAADMDGDGKPEIIVGDFYSTSVSILANNITTSTIDGSSFTRFGYPLADSAYGLNIADLNGDGQPEVILSRGKANTIAILKNTNTAGHALSNSSFIAGPRYYTGATSEPQGFCIGDIDGDTKPDIAVANYQSNTISLFENFSVPLSSPVIGTDTLCINATGMLHSQHCNTAAGYWRITNNHASITGGAGTADTGATITGISAGVDTVVYMVVNSYDTAFVNFIVNIRPLADTGIITGANAVCAGASITLADTTTGGVWSSTNGTIASVDAVTGVVTGAIPGNVVIQYTMQSFSCGPLTASHAVTVNALPDAGNITGPTGTCTGTSISLTASVAGGTWVNEYPLVATHVPAGAVNTVTGASVGVDTFLYVVTSAFCGTDTAVKAIAVVAASSSLPIVGDTSVCVFHSTPLSNSASGGVWSSANTSIATINPVTGVVTGVGAGTTQISYTITYSCGAIDTFISFTVNPLPNAGVIAGPTYVCLGSQITLTVSGATAPGKWISGDLSIYTVDSATGVVQSAAVGADTIFYTATNGCGVATSFILDTVRLVPPTDSITGAMPVCAGTTLTLSSTGGGLTGTWVSGSPLVATVSGGVVSAVSAGNAIISYTVSTACGLFTDTAEVKVYPIPAMVALADQAVCNGGAFVNIFNSTVVGSTFTWTNNDTSIGLGFSGAGDTILFTAANHTDSVVSATILVVPAANGCIGATDTFVIAVEPSPILSGSLAYSICDSALFHYVPSTTTAAVTYTWRRDVVAGIANTAGSGIDTISEVLDNTTTLPVVVTYVYTLTVNGCTDTQMLTVTVNPKPLLTTTLTPPDVCSHRLFSYSPAGSIAGATFNWHRPLVPGISNFAASGTDNPNEILRNTTDTFVTVTYTFTTAAYGCSSSQQVKVIVRPMPVLQNVPNDTICSGTPFTFTASALVAGTTFAWTRPVVAGITPASGSGTITIRDTLANTTFTRLEAVYIYTLTANACAYTQNVVLTVDPYAAPFPLITTKCPPSVCSNTLYQNFGTSHIPADNNAQYKWTASNAVVHATGNNDQYCLVSFPYPGDAVVTVTANVIGINCYLKDTFAVAVSTAVSENPSVLYLNNTQFVCLPSNEDTYQWGFDNPVLDSTILTGETSQEYVNVAPDFNNYYWVMTTHNGCSQKTYYTAPVGVHDVTANVAAINVYPNPASQNVTIELTGIDGINATAGIYDIAGHIITNAAMVKGRAVVDVQQLPPGIYMVGCYHNGVKLASARFVKN